MLSIKSRLALRVTAWLVIVICFIMSLGLGGLYFTGVYLPVERVRERVDRDASNVQETYQQRGRAAAIEDLNGRLAHPSEEDVYHALIDRSGKVLTGNLPSWPPVRRHKWVRIEADESRAGREDDHTVLTRDIALSDGTRLLVGRDIDLFDDREELIEDAAFWVTAALLLLGLPGGLILNRVIARRLDSISRTARMVMDGNLAGRFPVRGAGDDFEELSITLNLMLDRIEELVGSISRVSDHVAHELRTPLTRLRLSLEQAAESHDLEAARELVGQSLTETIRLQSLFDALLRIARLDTHQHGLALDEVRLDHLAADLVEMYVPQAEGRSQTLKASLKPAAARGDPDLLFQATANLLDNAIKYAPPGGSIEVQTYDSPTGSRIVVVDSGHGVGEQERRRLTERFFRGAGAHEVPGTGLGLSLAEAIVKAHGARLRFDGTDDGFAASVEFPRTG